MQAPRIPVTQASHPDHIVYTSPKKKKNHYPEKQVDTYQCNCIYIKITPWSTLTNYLQVASYRMIMY